MSNFLTFSFAVLSKTLSCISLLWIFVCFIVHHVMINFCYAKYCINILTCFIIVQYFLFSFLNQNFYFRIFNLRLFGTFTTSNRNFWLLHPF
jgi:hypothetical protein